MRNTEHVEKGDTKVIFAQQKTLVTSGNGQEEQTKKDQEPASSLPASKTVGMAKNKNLDDARLAKRATGDSVKVKQAKVEDFLGDY